MQSVYQLHDQNINDSPKMTTITLLLKLNYSYDMHIIKRLKYDHITFQYGICNENITCRQRIHQNHQLLLLLEESHAGEKLQSTF